MDKFGRIALTITISTGASDPEITQETTNEELLKILYRAARGQPVERFIEDVALWHCLSGYKDIEEEPNEKDIETLDKQLIHSMALQRAQTLLASPQLMQAMLLTFSQLLPALGLFDAPPQPHKDDGEPGARSGDEPGADDLLQ